MAISMYYASGLIPDIILDFKVITTARHGLQISLDYIEDHLNEISVDCVLGVNFARGLLYSSFNNGSHVMDRRTQELLKKINRILENSIYLFKTDPENGNDWKFKNLIEHNLWNTAIDYKEDSFKNFWNNPKTLLDDKDEWKGFPPSFHLKDSDNCLQEIINSTAMDQEFNTPCMVTTPCWTMFLQDGKGHGYFLTHKLLILETAKARKCLLDKQLYDLMILDICSTIMTEISQNYHQNFNEYFDLFLEQVLLCGYAGFTDFIQSDWLYRISKSQRLTGCFVDTLTDKLKSRIKRDFRYFNDGCNDHTTGLGAAVFALHYNYLINFVSKLN
ncbi:UPF0764 protein C16orf89 homolog [Euwallacea similis]|uniref:UPF0764 protein C16orf89 homolog n=1 Tax=Euwallacea similis TaxID=1736056 RepID=UPI00344BC506